MKKFIALSVFLMFALTSKSQITEGVIEIETFTKSTEGLFEDVHSKTTWYFNQDYVKISANETSTWTIEVSTGKILYTTIMNGRLMAGYLTLDQWRSKSYHASDQDDVEEGEDMNVASHDCSVISILNAQGIETVVALTDQIQIPQVLMIHASPHVQGCPLYSATDDGQFYFEEKAVNIREGVDDPETVFSMEIPDGAREMKEKQVLRMNGVL